MNLSDALNASGIGGVQGILFDIDETLVDLRTASIAGFIETAKEDFKAVPGNEVLRIAEDFADDVIGAYGRYMSGELTFLGQRELRLRNAYGHAKLMPPADDEFLAWADEYELKVRAAWKPFPDVLPFLEFLDSLQIPYGAVSNNVEDYQRKKLAIAGIPGFDIVIGSDTAGAPKPGAAPFIAGCQALGTELGQTLYIGDNPETDIQGAVNAGLRGLLINRGSTHVSFEGDWVESFDHLSSFFLENPGFFARKD